MMIEIKVVGSKQSGATQQLIEVGKQWARSTTSPRSVLVITKTTKLAKEMEQRIGFWPGIVVTDIHFANRALLATPWRCVCFDTKPTQELLDLAKKKLKLRIFSALCINES